MTCRYAHKRVATLFTAMQAPAAARVIEWPQKHHHAVELRGRPIVTGKPLREGNYASK